MTRVLIVVAVLLYSSPAVAQESGQVGLTLAYPASVGLIWHATDAIAIRPDFSFSHTHNEGGTNVATSNSWGFGVGVSALFYTGAVRDNVRTYLVPRFAYTRTNTDSEFEGVPLNTDHHVNSYQYSGSFGVQYTPMRRFGLYGEVGLQYSTSESIFTTVAAGIPAAGKSTSSQFGTRAGVGVIVYCK